MPLQHAFNTSTDNGNGNWPDLDWTQSNGLADPKIIEIRGDAQNIQKQLNRSVWNGNIMQRSTRQNMGESFSKTLLWEISKAGEQTRQLFQNTLQNLTETTQQTMLQQQQLAAMLAIDLMDRNLYERANDCRWWSLTDTLENALLKPTDKEQAQAAEDCLKYINSLYTVYTDVLLISPKGLVLANSGEKNLQGTHIQAPWIDETLKLRDQEEYIVSDFAPSELYQDRPTYIYCAALYNNRHTPTKALGVIALVFDSEPQFEAILNDSRPCGIDSLAYIVDPTGAVVSSNTERFIENGKLRLELPPEATAHTRNASGSSLIQIDGIYYALGYSHSGQYREYKDSDCSYQNNLSCFYLTPLAPELSHTNGIKKH
ncbi:MAG: hypothetical protein HC848_05005 [Limnobacter sp.]|nr:hypothetical protein [Limnobacter sp.]